MSGAGGRTRREILADAAKAAAAASVAGLAGCFPSVGGKWPDAGEENACSHVPDAGEGPVKPDFRPATNAVVEVFRDDSVTKKGAKNIITAAVVPEMLAAGLKAMAREVQNAGIPDGGSSDLTGPEDLASAWKILLPRYQPGHRIGLKVNCLNPQLPTSGAIIRSIVSSLKDDLGVEPANIIVWDRVLEELNTKAHYTADDLAEAKLLGTLVSTAKATDGEPGYGNIICPPIEDQTPRLSRIMTDLTEVTINCPVLKTHNVSGVTAAMKNIYGIIDMPGKYHKTLPTALPKLYALPAVRNSLVLTIVDALIGIVTGDTESSPDETPKRILLAQDPVAMDNYSLELVNQLRAAQPHPFGPLPTSNLGWIDLAHEMGLGNKNYSLVKVS